MKWITRERPKIDRIACPWLIRKFVDPSAEFIFVPRDQVFALATVGRNSIRYSWCQISHVGDQCTFDYIVDGIQDKADPGELP